MRETGFFFRRSAGRTAAAGSAGCGQQYKYGLCKSVCVWQAEKQMGRILSLPLFGHPRRAQILRRQSRHGNSLPLHRRLVRNRCNYRSYFHFRQTEKLLHLKTAPELAFRGGIFSLKERDKKQRCALSKHSAVFGAANQIRTGDPFPAKGSFAGPDCLSWGCAPSPRRMRGEGRGRKKISTVLF